MILRKLIAVAAALGCLLSLSTENLIAGKNAKKKVDPLEAQVNKAIEITSKRVLTANVHTPWQILHGMLALRHDFKIQQGDKQVAAIDWLVDNATFGGKPVFKITRHGAQGHPYTRDYVMEGHPNQFLAILTMSNLPLDFEMRTGGQKITMADVVRSSKMDVNAREEITWTLWALSHYLPSNARWHNKYGDSWSIERLVQIQTYQRVSEGACGGTHGLYALVYARNKHVLSGGSITGVWFEAQQKINRYIETARWAQNYDGSFSADYFQSRKFARDFTTRIETSGHILEFLVMALSNDRLSEDWVRRGVNSVSRELIDNRKKSAKCGPLYHALHGLVLFRDRVFPREQLAKKETEPKKKSETQEKVTEVKKPVKVVAKKPEKSTKPVKKTESKVEKADKPKKAAQAESKTTESSKDSKKAAARPVSVKQKTESKSEDKTETVKKAKMKVKVSNAKASTSETTDAKPAKLKSDDKDTSFEKPVVKKIEAEDS